MSRGQKSEFDKFLDGGGTLTYRMKGEFPSHRGIPNDVQFREKAAIRTCRQLEDAIRMGGILVLMESQERCFDVFLSKNPSGAMELIGSIPYPLEDESVVQSSGAEGERPGLSLMKAGILAGIRVMLQKGLIKPGSRGKLNRDASRWLIQNHAGFIEKEDK